MAAVGAFLGSAAVTIGTFAISWGSIIFTVGSLLYGQSTQRKQQRQAADQARKGIDDYNASLRDKTVSGVATEFPYRIIYGDDRVGCNIVAIFADGPKDELKYMICVIAQHEITEIVEVYLNGKPVGPLGPSGEVITGAFYAETTAAYQGQYPSSPFVIPVTPFPGTVEVIGANYDPDTGILVPAQLLGSSVAGSTVTAISDTVFDQYLVKATYIIPTPRVFVWKHLGTATDPVDPATNAALPTKWPTTAVLRGHAYIALRIDLNQPEFQSGIPHVEARVKGKKLFDPRVPLAAPAWNDNNVLVVLDYLTSELGGVPIADIPVDQFIAAANDCDDIVSTGSWSGKRYTFNGSVTSMEQREQVLEKMAQSMAGGLVAVTWDIYAGKAKAPIMALSQEDIVGEIAFSPGYSRNEIYNTVKGVFISPENSYVVNDYVPYVNQTFLALDGEELTTNIDLPYTNQQQRCTNLARIFTEDSRNAFCMNGKFSLKTYKLKIGDRVTFTSPLFGQTAKLYRLTDRTCAPDQAMLLGFKEDAASIYDLADQVLPDATPNTDLPNPFVIPALGTLTAESGTAQLLLQADGTIVSRIFLQWPISIGPNIQQHGNIEIEYQEILATDWQKLSVTGDQVSAYILPVHDNHFYLVRARAVNPYLNSSSDWTYAPLHQVIGKTERPPDVIDLGISGAILTWTPVVALDLAGYVFRFHYGSSQDWNSAVPLHSGLILASPFDLVTRPGGTVTIMVKAVDQSGNESKKAGIVTTDLGDPPIENVVETINITALGYPGTISGGAIVGTEILANALDSFYGTDDQSFYGLDTEPLYEASTYGQVIYTTGDIAIESALAGSVLTILLTSAGVDLVIEYRNAGPGSLYGPNGDSFYGADADPFYDAPGAWLPWPGQVLAENDVYQLRFTIGAGPVRGTFSQITLIVDAPDILEFINDLPVSAAGTVIPYTSNFTEIKTVTPTLQANASGGVTVETDKTVNLAPVLHVYNSSHVAVSGATVDVILKGR